MVGVTSVLLAACSSSPAQAPPAAPLTTAPAATSVPTAPAATAQTAAVPAAGTPTTAGGITSATATRPCVGAPAPAAWRHVIWIWFENKPATSVVGSSSAPYISGLAAECASATDYHGITHPSLPNYVAATSGSTHGITDDAGPAAHPLSGESLFSQVAAAGAQWRAYNESMPGPCAPVSAGTYAVKHNPAAYYTSIRSDCTRWDVGLDRLSPDSLPAFSFVTPNLCHDMHDCSVATGDRWLSGMLPTLLGSAAFRRGDTAIFVTWDEDDGSHSNLVPLLVIAPSVTPGSTIGQRLDHHALLRTTEQMLGLPPLGAAASAAAIPGL
jgi:hypothetical protein